MYYNLIRPGQSSPELLVLQLLLITEIPVSGMQLGFLRNSRILPLLRIRLAPEIGVHLLQSFPEIPSP